MNLRNLSIIRERITQRMFPKDFALVRWWNQDRESAARIVSVTLVMVLAAGIRLWGLNQIGFNTDEAVYSGQAAAIAQVPVLRDIFPVFRAHPLLFQFFSESRTSSSHARAGVCEHLSNGNQLYDRR